MLGPALPPVSTPDTGPGLNEVRSRASTDDIFSSLVNGDTYPGFSSKTVFRAKPFFGPFFKTALEGNKGHGGPPRGQGRSPHQFGGSGNTLGAFLTLSKF